MKSRSLIAFILFWISCSTWAGDERGWYYGAEPTVTNDQLHRKFSTPTEEAQIQKQIFDALAPAVEKAVGQNLGLYRFERLGTWHILVQKKVYDPDLKPYHTRYDDVIKINFDPGVVECQIAKQNLADHHEMARLVDEFFYTPARQVGLKPDVAGGAGGGHISINLSRFKTVLEFRNFMVYLANHHWGNGPMGRSKKNAPSLWDLDPEQRQAFEKVIHEMDTGKFRSVQEAANSFAEQVYTSTPLAGNTPLKYQSVALHVGQDRIEFRNIRPFADSKEITQWFELMEGLTKHITAQKGALKLAPFHTQPDSKEIARAHLQMLDDAGIPATERNRLIRSKWLEMMEKTAEVAERDPTACLRMELR